MTDTIPQILDGLTGGKFSSIELLESFLAIAARNAPLNAFVRQDPERARKQAREADMFFAKTKRLLGRLHGIPVALKDNIDEAGVPCTAGSRAYRDRIPEHDSTVVQHLKNAGAVIFGRTNMHELADGVTSENSAYGPVHNPWRAGYHPGGSSGGSAVAVAAGIVPAALGTDTGGSIRIPAALCGVAGFKPTYGVISTRGVMPLSSTLDHVGPLARTVEDVAVLWSVLSGSPEVDLASLGSRKNYRLGVLQGFGLEADSGIQKCFGESLNLLLSLGCNVQWISLPCLASGIRLLSDIYAPEAARFHAEQLEKTPGDFSAEVFEDLQRGSGVSADREEKAKDERIRFQREIEELTEGLDFLVCPSTPHAARPFGSPKPHTYLTYTCPFNLTGQPAISVPMGLDDGLPVGLQLIGKKGDDSRLLQLAFAFEQNLKLKITAPNSVLGVLPEL